MRLAKTLGLALIAALALSALVGVSSAAANQPVLCKVSNETPCSAANTYPSGTKIKGKLKPDTKAVLKAQTNAGTTYAISCQVSEVEGETKEEKGTQASEQLKGQITNATFGSAVSKCTDEFGGECQVETLQLPWQASVTQVGLQDNGTMQVYEHSAGTGQPGARIECAERINCIFKVKEVGQEAKEVGMLAVTGGNPAQVKANQLELKKSLPVGGDCTPVFSEIKQGLWDAEYEVTEPKPVFVSHQ